MSLRILIVLPCHTRLSLLECYNIVYFPVPLILAAGKLRLATAPFWASALATFWATNINTPHLTLPSTSFFLHTLFTLTTLPSALFPPRTTPSDLGLYFTSPLDFIEATHHTSRDNEAAPAHSSLLGSLDSRHLTTMSNNDRLRRPWKGKRPPQPTGQADTPGYYRHYLCGQSFSNLQAVADHHYGPRNRKRGCRDRYNDPHNDAPWRDPTCQRTDHYSPPSRNRVNHARAEPTGRELFARQNRSEDATLAPGTFPPQWGAKALEGQERAQAQSDPIVIACVSGVILGKTGEDETEPSSSHRSRKDTPLGLSELHDDRSSEDAERMKESVRCGYRSMEDGQPDHRSSEDNSARTQSCLGTPNRIAVDSGTANIATSYGHGARERPVQDEASAPGGPGGRREPRPQLPRTDQLFLSASIQRSELSQIQLTAGETMEELQERLARSQRPQDRAVIILIQVAISFAARGLDQESNVTDSIVKWMAPDMDALQLAYFRLNPGFENLVLGLAKHIEIKIFFSDYPPDVFHDMQKFVRRYGDLGPHLDAMDDIVNTEDNYVSNHPPRPEAWQFPPARPNDGRKRAPSQHNNIPGKRVKQEPENEDHGPVIEID
ncbi:hypothetical protein BU16DRAFT_609553 [Lophium mytilinum]|uniref:Uncharacterized protein n=1 Tax=Lophium mytilinum TaxID=390894 RepID=A0A6A6QWK4_9PEZI|nr:hypothetical protein BU16DRAFT_609553 [Lophium mytilinum]